MKMYENRQTRHSSFCDAIIELGVPEPGTILVCSHSNEVSLHKFV